VRHPHHFADIVRDGCQVARLKLADVDHHVNFSRPVFDRLFGVINFCLGGHCSEWEADRCADFDVRASQGCFAVGYPITVHAHRAEVVFQRLFAEDRHLLSRCVRLEQGMIDDAHQRNGLIGGVSVHAGINLLNVALFVEVGCHGLPVGCKCFLKSINGLEIFGGHK